jgi:hypothetical protein
LHKKVNHRSKILNSDSELEHAADEIERGQREPAAAAPTTSLLESMVVRTSLVL